MRSPTLHELPPPPLGKTGWPWTAESPQLSDVMPDGSPWPRISIVTPSYNQGKFIEETIRSVLLQGYPDLEYIIIDGGSSDESVAIIKKYAPWLSYWVSEPDNGQSHAINKGFSRATGMTIAWLNSDDIYLSDVFRAITEYVSVDRSRQVVFGDCHAVDEYGNVISAWKGRFSNRRDLLRWWKRERVTGPIWILQPSVFFSRDAFTRTGFLDESLYYVLDYEYWIRLSGAYKFFHIERTLSTYRLHDNSKSVTRDKEKQLVECARVSKRNWGSKFSLFFWYCWFGLARFRGIRKSQEYYRRALEHYECRRHRQTLKYILASLLISPLGRTSWNYISIISHIFARKIQEVTRKLLRAF